MKTISLLITLVFLFSLGIGVLAQETELPNPGLTPDSPFYFLEIIAERIGTFFTFGDLKKAERHASLAAERLAEAQAVVEKGKPELAEKTLERYKSQLEKSMTRAEKAILEGKDFGKVMEVMAKVGRTTSVHLEVLAEVYEKVPEQAKPAIENAIKASVKGHEKAVKALKASNNLGEVPEEVSLPEKVPQEVRERVRTRVQQELEIEEVLGGLDLSKSPRVLCIEGGGLPEMCERFPDQSFKSFKQIEDFCVEQGGPPELCSSLEAKCREFGATTAHKCFLLLSISSIKAYTSTELKTSAAPTSSEKEMEERRRIEEEIEDERRGEGENAKIGYAHLGVTFSTINDDMQTERELPVSRGALLITVVPDGPAALAGLKKGDIILEFHGEKITEDNNLTEVMSRSEVGAVVNLKVLRGEEAIIINTALIERPAN